MSLSSTASVHTATSPETLPRLPRLPIPPLKDTLKRYLKSLEPFLLEDAAKGGQSYEDALRERVAWAKEFEDGLGRVCQQRLIGAPFYLWYQPRVT